MKKIITVALAAIMFVGCGYSSVGNEAICQPKKIHHITPIFCNNYDTVDVSLGVMRNGVGSMSTQDVELAFDPANQEQNEKTLLTAINAGKLVNLHYNDRRFSWCQNTEQVSSVDIVETSQEVNEDKEARKRALQDQIDKLNAEGK